MINLFQSNPSMEAIETERFHLENKSSIFKEEKVCVASQQIIQTAPRILDSLSKTTIREAEPLFLSQVNGVFCTAL